jgi:DNA-binding LacI/PurR family transcriptional regulator
VTIKEIAELSGTSVATVSRVLNNRDDMVAPHTRRKVLDVIEQTGYRPNNIGRALRKQKSKKMLIMLPMLNMMYTDIVRSFEEVARAKGYDVLLAITNRQPELERKYFDLVYTKQVDGVAAFIPTITYEEINAISSNFPFIACCWRGRTNDVDVNYVCIDNEKAAYDMTNYLISLGHSDIAFVYDDRQNRLFEGERFQGYQIALKQAGIPFREELCIICGPEFQSAYLACERITSMKTMPSAVFATSDERALGIVKHLQEKGFRIGRDIDVVGFDNVAYSTIPSPEITTIAQPMDEIGREAANLLLAKINNRDMSNRGVVLSHQLVIRESTRQSAR